MAEARKEAIQAKKSLRQNIDPVIKRRQEKQSKARNTFRSLAEEWHDKQKGGWDPTHAGRVLRSLEVDVFPVIGDIVVVK